MTTGTYADDECFDIHDYDDATVHDTDDDTDDDTDILTATAIPSAPCHPRMAAACGCSGSL